MGNISDFLNDLAEKPELQQEFDEAPLKTMRKAPYKLNAEQRELVLEGTVADLRTAIAKERNVDSADVFMVKMRP